MDLLGKEIKIDGKEGEIINFLGSDWVEVEFFNVNDGKIRFPKKDIEKYIVEVS